MSSLNSASMLNMLQYSADRLSNYTVSSHQRMHVSKHLASELSARKQAETPKHSGPAVDPMCPEQARHKLLV